MGCESIGAAMVSFPDPRPRHPYHMHEMIRGQPKYVAETLRRVRALEPVEAVRDAPRVVLTGCGTSFHAAMYGARVLSRGLGPRSAVEAVHAYDFLFAREVPSDAVVVGVSHSGNTPTTNRALARARRAGARVVGLCGLDDSPMAKVVDAVWVIGSVHDRSWANTMSYTTQLAAFASLAARASHHSGEAAALDRLPAVLRRALACEPAVRRLARKIASRERVTFLGTGLDEITALEAALKIRETCSLSAAGYHTEQFLHGPFLSLDRGDAIVALRSQDDGWRADAILRGFAEAAGLVARIGDGPSVDITLPRMPAFLRPIVSVVPMQFLAYWSAAARGANPDIMRTDVARYAAAIEELFTWRPLRAGSGRRSPPPRRSGG